jgi:hypothetical protein
MLLREESVWIHSKNVAVQYHTFLQFIIIFMIFATFTFMNEILHCVRIIIKYKLQIFLAASFRQPVVSVHICDPYSNTGIAIIFQTLRMVAFLTLNEHLSTNLETGVYSTSKIIAYRATSSILRWATFWKLDITSKFEGFWRWCNILCETVLLVFIHRLGVTQRFGSWFYFRMQVKGG